MGRKKRKAKAKSTKRDKRLASFGWTWERCSRCPRETWRRKGQTGPLVCGVCRFDEAVK